jgi:predicted nucleic-acid-binding Zn-ribbon protein
MARPFHSGLVSWRGRLAMKKSKQCPKCESLRVGILRGVREDKLLYPKSDGTYSGSTAADIDRDAFICTECGYYESYVRHFDSVLWDELYDFQWMNPKPQPDGPYR